MFFKVGFSPRRLAALVASGLLLTSASATALSTVRVA
jgi:hypothetical protein